MKKLILILCFSLSFCGMTKAQTQDTSTATTEETLDWINSKLSLYKHDYNDANGKGQIQIITVDVNSCQLIINWKGKISGVDVSYDVFYTYTIPIDEIYLIGEAGRR